MNGDVRHWIDSLDPMNAQREQLATTLFPFGSDRHQTTTKTMHSHRPSRLTTRQPIASQTATKQARVVGFCFHVKSVNARSLAQFSRRSDSKQDEPEKRKRGWNRMNQNQTRFHWAACAWVHGALPYIHYPRQSWCLVCQSILHTDHHHHRRQTTPIHLKTLSLARACGLGRRRW